MDRRAKAKLNRDKAPHLNEIWHVNAVQVRYSDDGHWYATLSRFPAALFDATGYILFVTEDAYLSSPYIKIGKQISVGKPGISAIPGYVQMIEENTLEHVDLDMHTFEVTEGSQQLVIHLRRERNQALVQRKKKIATSLNCEVCGFSFNQVYGESAAKYCEVHHIIPLADAGESMKTRIQDLAILCANCHRVIHLRNPPYLLTEIREMLAKQKYLSDFLRDSPLVGTNLDLTRDKSGLRPSDID